MTLLMTRLRWVRISGVALIALAALTSAATAQVTAEQQSAIRSNCRSDFMSKCSGVTPGGKDALMCLQKNVASLSPGCKTAVSATIPAPAPAEAKPAQAAPAPAPAAATAAPAATPAAAPPAPASAPPAIMIAPPPPATASSAPAAAKTQQAPKPAAVPKQPDAAPPKQAAVAPAAPFAPAAAAPPAAAPAPTAQQMSAIKFTCKREFSRFCKGVAPGGAEAVACLRGNAAKLSADCKTSLADLGDAMPAATGPVVPPQPAGTPKAPIVMTAVIGRSCVRDLIKHCRDVGVGDGQKIACLTAHADSLTVLCRTAMKITTPLQR